ncbi:MAG: DUF411 domain-containing protein [Cyanobacteria bacterium J06634_6]
MTPQSIQRGFFAFKRSSYWVSSITISLAVIVMLLTSCGQGPSRQEPAALAKVAQASELTVFRSPTCGCCGKWVEYMEAFGFQIRDNITEDMAAIEQQYGVPSQLRSCHTAIANGYVIEGHIPAEDVARLLSEKPDISGIAVPGMPVGSPGMESGDYVEPYEVLSFTDSGEMAVFAAHS